MSNIPTPVMPNFGKLFSNALTANLALTAEAMSLSMRNPLLLTEMVNPRSAIPAMSRATSAAIGAQTRIGLTLLSLMTDTVEESLLVAESLPLGKEAMGPLPERTREALSRAKTMMGDRGRQAGMAFAY